MPRCDNCEGLCLVRSRGGRPCVLAAGHPGRHAVLAVVTPDDKGTVAVCYFEGAGGFCYADSDPNRLAPMSSFGRRELLARGRVLVPRRR